LSRSWGVEQLEVRTLLSASALPHNLLFESTVFSGPVWSEIEQIGQDIRGSIGNLSNQSLFSGTNTFTTTVNGNSLPTAAADSQKNQKTTSSSSSAPAITSSASTTFTVGTNSLFTVTASGSPTPTFSESGTLPSGVSFNSTTGALSGTPAPGSGGTYNLTFTATNGVTPNANQSFVLTVDQAPAITSSNATSFSVGASGTFAVTASGFPTPILSEAGSLPAGVSFNSSTGVLSGTPQPGTVGTYPLVFTASNGVGTAAQQNFTLTVDTAPAITSANSTTFAVGASGTFTVTATGLPVPNVAETGALPNGVTFNTATDVLSGTPLPGTGGTYDLTFTASNGVSPNATQSFVLTVNQAPSITSSNSTIFTVGSAGTFTVTAAGFPTPTLSESGTLPIGVSFDSSTGVLSGTPQIGTTGTYDLEFSATNGVGSAANQAFTLVINVAPAITSPNATTFAVGSAGSFTVTASGMPSATFTEAGALPNGVSFNDATGVLSGTPSTGTGGIYDLTFTASNGISPNATQSFILTVDEGSTITSASTTTFQVGVAGTFTVTTGGFPAATFGETGALPYGVSFNTATGVLSGTPEPGTGGVYNLTITASNGIVTDPSQNFTLVVEEVPAITSGNATTFTVGQFGSFSVTANGYPGSALTEVGALPSGVSFNWSSGVLSGTPQPGTGGTYDLTFTPTNVIGTGSTQSFILTVNEAPSITSATGTVFTVGTSGSFTVTASGYPASTINETGNLPTGVFFNSTTGVLSGTPQLGSGGTYDLTFTPVNLVGTGATQDFTLIVDQSPTITSPSGATFTVGTQGSFNITASGDPAATFGETGSLPTGITFNAATGVLAGTPQLGTGGTYDLTITATNGFSPDATQSFVLLVDQAPAITSANGAVFTVGTAGTFTVTASGYPTPSFAETGTLPIGVTFDDSTGALSGTPLVGTGGTYDLTITATNGVGPDTSQTFTLTVINPPVFTSANSATFVVGTAGTFDVTAAGVPGPILSESGALPNGVSFNASTGVLSGTPATGSGGTYNLTFTATNGVSPDASQSFTLVVDEAPTITSVNGANFTVGTADTFDLTATGFPTPTFNEAGALPNGLSFSPTGLLSGTPLPGTGGTYSVTFTPVNSVGIGPGQVFTITVDETPSITSPSTTVFTVGAAGTFDVLANGFPTSTFAETGALPAGVSFNSSTGLLSGTPLANTGGTYALTITPTNTAGTGPTQNFTLVVDQAPTITSANSTTFTVGTSGTFDVTASGFPAPTFAESGTLPNGVSFRTGGTFDLTITATNGVSPVATQSFTLSVVNAPVITSANSATFVVGTAGTFDVTAIGMPAPSLSESGALPIGVSFNASTGVLSGMPATGTGGTYDLTFTATNGVSPAASQSFTLIVDEAPAITSLNSATFTVGTAGSFDLAANGFPAPTFNVAGTLPNGVAFSPNGVLSGTPLPGTGGIYNLTFTPVNSVGVGPGQLFTLVVLEDPPITSANSTTFTVGTAGSFTVTASGFPASTFAETGILPAGVSFSTSTGLLSGTPQAGTGGTYDLTFTATNIVGTGPTQDFTFTVDQAPTIISVNDTTFTVGTSGTFEVTASGDPASTYSETGTLPNGVSLNPSTGVLSGTPAPGSGGTYNLTLFATNGVTPVAIQGFILTVDEAPTITSANSTTFTVGSAGTFDVTANGFPASAFVETGTLPNGVAFNSSTGVLSGTPLTGSGGTYTLTFSPTNAVTTGSTQDFTLIVEQAPAITSANSATFPVGLLNTFDVTASGFPAATIAETGTLPNGVSFSSSTGFLSGTPLAGTTGVYILSFTPTNAVTTGPTQTFTLVVDQAPAITSVNNAVFTVGSNGTFDVTANGSPNSTFSETGALPAGVTFNNATGVLSGTPLPGSGGVYSLTFTATNGVTPNATQTFSLTVLETPEITSNSTTTFTVGTSGTFAVTANGFPAATFLISGTLPNGVSFNSTTGLFTGTPQPGTGGTYPLNITPLNLANPGLTQMFTLLVDQAPAITSPNSTIFTVGTGGAFTATVTGFPAPALSLSGALPAGVSFNPSTGMFIGTPQLLTGGTYPLTLTASNGVTPNATQTFTLIVDESPLISSPNSTTFTVGTNSSFQVTATGYPASIFSESDTLPAGLSFSITTGVLSGTPMAGTAGSYTLHFTAFNTVGSSPIQTFTLIIVQPPAITSANNATFTVGSFASFNVTATGFPAPTFEETGALPNGVTFNDTTGVLSGTPTLGSDGIYTFTIIAMNGVDPEAMQTFTLTVDA
jgi:large repetitive protein